jgi:hypothetical protein
MQSASRGQEPGQCCKHCPVGQDSRGLLTWRRNTVTSWRSTRILGFWRCGPAVQASHQLPEDQTQQSYRHDRRSCPTTTVQRCRRAPPWIASSAPAYEAVHGSGRDRRLVAWRGGKRARLCCRAGVHLDPYPVLSLRYGRWRTGLWPRATVAGLLKAFWIRVPSPETDKRDGYGHEYR